MAPQQDKTVKEQKEDKKYKVDVVELPKEPEENKEEKEAKEERAKKKTEVKEESVKGRTEVKLDVLAEQDVLSPDTHTQETIDAVAVEKISEEREANEALELIGGVAVTILSKFFDNGVEISAVDTIEEFKIVLNQVKKEARFAELRKKINSIPEQAALRKLEETLANPESLLFKKLSKDWPTFISKSKEIFHDVKEGPASKAWEWAKDNPGKVALAIVGAYALYNLFFKKKSEKEKAEDKDKNWTDRLFNKDSMLALGVLTIGALIGSKHIRDWLSENVVGKAKDAVMETADKVKEASVKWLDEKIHFTKMMERLKAFAPKLLPDWLKDAKLAKIAEDMGISQEDIDSWKKYATPSGALLLLTDWGRKRKMDNATKGLLERFTEHEKIKETSGETPIAADVIHHKDYGEMLPINKALPEYINDIEAAMIPIVNWAEENKYLLAAAGIFLAQYEIFRKTAATGFTMTKDLMISLTQLPFKTVRNFPLTTLFAVTAILLAEDNKPVQDALGRIYVPKDPENLKKYIKQRIKDAGAWADNIPAISNANIDIAVEIMTEKGKLAEYIGDKPAEYLESAAMGLAEIASLSPEEIRHAANIQGINIFYRNILVIKKQSETGSEEYEAYDPLLERITELKQKIKSKQPVSAEDYLKLNDTAKDLGINIFIEDGYIYWTKTTYQEGMPVVFGPSKIGIDPSLSDKDAFQYARKFAVEQDLSAVPGQIVKTPLEYLRLMAGDIMFEDVETMDEATGKLEKKLRSGWMIAFYGGMTFLCENINGVWHKYSFVPIAAFKYLWGKSFGKEYSAVDVAFDYADGIVPVTMLGITAAVLKADWKGILTGKVIAKSAAYPITATMDIARLGIQRWHYRNHERPFEAMMKDPKLKITSDFWSSYNRWAYVRSLVYTGKSADKIQACRRNLAKLYKSKMNIHQSFYHKFFQDKYLTAADRALEGIGKEYPMDAEHRNDNLKDIDAKIKKLELRIKRIREHDALHEAMDLLRDGKDLKAKAKLKKYGYAGPFTEEAMSSRINELQNEIKELDIIRKKYPPVHEQEAHAQEAKKINDEFVEIERQKQAELTEARSKAAENGESLTSKSLQRNLDKIEAKHNKRLVEAFERRKVHIAEISPEILARHKLEIPRSTEEMIESMILAARASKRAKIRQFGGKFGRGLGAAILGIAIAMGAYKGIEYLRGKNEVLDLEALYKAETKEQKEEREKTKEKLEDEPELQENVMLQIQDHLRSVHAEYNDFFASIFTPEKLKDLPESELIRLVNAYLPVHAQRMEKLKKFLAVNRDAVVAFYKSHPDEKEKDITKGINLFAIGYNEDTERPYLKYADESDFKEAIYTQVDMMRKYIDKFIAGKEPTLADHAVDAGLYIVPVVGTYRDGRDTYNAIRRGDWETAAWSGTWTVIGGVADALLVTGFASAAGAGLRGIRGAVGVTRGAVKGAEVARESSKIVKALETIHEISKLHYGKVAIGAMGADLGRQLVKPELNEKYEF